MRSSLKEEITRRKECAYNSYNDEAYRNFFEIQLVSIDVGLGGTYL